MVMANESAMYAVERIESLILTIRGQRVMLDSDLAKIYGVTTKQLNQQFRRLPTLRLSLQIKNLHR
jgi:outer membrane receptor for Fe3+-dicitrate